MFFILLLNFYWFLVMLGPPETPKGGAPVRFFSLWERLGRDFGAVLGNSWGSLGRQSAQDAPKSPQDHSGRPPPPVCWCSFMFEILSCVCNASILKNAIVFLWKLFLYMNQYFIIVALACLYCWWCLLDFIYQVELIWFSKLRNRIYQVTSGA